MWLDSIERIYLIKKGVKEASDIDQTDLDNFHKFLLTRIQVFMMKTFVPGMISMYQSIMSSGPVIKLTTTISKIAKGFKTFNV